MTSSTTRSASFTLTDARYVAAKIGADLRRMSALYGKPATAEIPDYVEEAALLLRDGYLGTVDYGFLQTNGVDWKLRLRYTATTGGGLRDDRPGSFPASVEIGSRKFHSFLTYSDAFHNLTAAERGRVEQSLPISRVNGVEPAAGNGSYSTGHGYGRNGAGVSRNTYLAN